MPLQKNCPMSFVLFVLSSAGAALGCVPSAHAENSDGVLGFDLTPVSSSTVSESGDKIGAIAQTNPNAPSAANSSNSPILTPPTAVAPLGSGVAVSQLPPPPQKAFDKEVEGQQAESMSQTAEVAMTTSDPALRFCATAVCPSPQAVYRIQADPSQKILPDNFEPASTDLQQLFAGGADSLVAIALGAAEGTRTSNGSKTAAYWGHVDPGNGAWNLGSFSYQHQATSPEDADQQQLIRLKQQAIALQQQASDRGVLLSPASLLNGIDLANQSPEAALSAGGYVDRLLEAQNMGLHGDEAIHWARVRSFLDPDSRQWNAPGLGNRVDRISADQERRMTALKTVQIYLTQMP